jgi:XapX domain-containing protein
MKIYVVSMLGGVLVGAVYALIGVRSPAPPVIALLGLLGMLLGEQGFTLAARLVKGQPLTSAWLAAECVPKITGAPPPASPGPRAVGAAVESAPNPATNADAK